MSCSRDGHCLVIANNYVSRKESINSDLASVKENINTISEQLNAFIVPDDYIGSKVKEKLESISKEFESNSDNVTSFSGEVNSFIDAKAEEHRNHYQTWKKRQEKLAEEKAGEDNGT